METQKKIRLKKKIAPDERLPEKEPRLTQIAIRLYNHIYAFGIKSCFKSNETLAYKFRCSIRSVRRARQLLVRRQDIIVARPHRRTCSMWARLHPAVQNCEILFSKAVEIKNPFFVTPRVHARMGGQNVLLRGTKCPPKIEYSNPNGLHSGGGSKNSEAGGAGGPKSQRGGPSETPQAVQEGKQIQDVRRREFDEACAEYSSTKY